MLWAPMEKGKGFFCSKLSEGFKTKARDIMKMVLKKKIPETILNIDWDSYGEIIKESDILEEIDTIVMTKGVLPIEVEDIEEVVAPIKTVYRKILDSEEDDEHRKIIEILGELIDSVEYVYEDIASLAREIQELAVLKKPSPILTGVEGPPPSLDSQCLAFASHFLAQETKDEGNTGTKLGSPTTWITKDSTIYKAELCPLTNKWFWTSVAKCSCSHHKENWWDHDGKEDWWDHDDGEKGDWYQDEKGEWHYTGKEEPIEMD